MFHLAFVAKKVKKALCCLNTGNGLQFVESVGETSFWVASFFGFQHCTAICM